MKNDRNKFRQRWYWEREQDFRRNHFFFFFAAGEGVCVELSSKRQIWGEGGRGEARTSTHMQAVTDGTSLSIVPNLVVKTSGKYIGIMLTFCCTKNWVTISKNSFKALLPCTL